MPADEPPSHEALVRAVLAGDRHAFAALSLALWPMAQAAARRLARGAGRHVSGSAGTWSTLEGEDEAQELFARVLERLEADDHAALRTFAGWKERHPEKEFADWIRIVMANLARDRRREREGRGKREEEPSGALPSAKRLLNELAALEPLDDLSHRPPFTSAETAREILDFARANLPPLQYAALAGWIEGESFDEVRARTGVASDDAAARLVRAALAVLRRRFTAERV